MSYLPNMIDTSTFFLTSIKDIIFSIKKPKSEKPQIFTMTSNESIVSKIDGILEYKPNILAKSGKAHTMLQIMSYLRFFNYEREYLYLRDGQLITLDWKYNVKYKNINDTPIILLLHGLGGNSQSPYLKKFTSVAINKGYKIVVYNRRCHNKDISSINCVPFPKHVNMEDMEDVVNHIDILYPYAKKYLVGFSAGANLAIKYYAQHMDNPFQACVSISNGYNIYKGLQLMRDKQSINIVCNFIKDLLNKNTVYNILKYNPDIDINKVISSKTLIELEENLVVPLYNYESIEEYYNDDSCHHVIDKVSKPLLCICSRDDPFVNQKMIDVPINASMKNENIITIVTKSGGHIGWIDESFQPWYINIVLSYFDQINPLK